jgi:anti-sigma B factor antagonist
MRVDGDTPHRPSDPISIEVGRRGNACVVTVAGEIDLATTPRLRAALANVLDPSGPPPLVVLDLSRVTFIASIGLAVVVRAHREASAQGGVLRLVVDTRPAVVEALAATGIRGLVGTYDDLGAAVGDPVG